MDAAGNPSQLLLNAQKELQKRRQLAGITYHPPCPAGDASLTLDWLKKLSPSPADPSINVEGRSTPAHPKQAQGDKQHQGNCQTRGFDHKNIIETNVRVSPTIAAACLNHDQQHNGFALDGPYRLYKILQILDKYGRGWLDYQTVSTVLTAKKSPSFIYGKRQLKIMLRRGEGLFWQRVKSAGAGSHSSCFPNKAD